MAAVIVACVASVVAALVARSVEPSQWRSDDWASLAMAVLLAVLFFVIAQVLQARQTAAEERTRRRELALQAAVADGILVERTGLVTINALRTRDVTQRTSDFCALSIANDALAAMPLFRLATAARQTEFLDSVRGGYSALVLNSFSRGRELPRAVADHLVSGAHALEGQLSGSVGHAATVHEEVQAAVATTRSHVRACREWAELWRDPRTTRVPSSVAFVREIYEPELRVHRRWKASGVARLDAEIIRRDLDWLGDCYSPWYLRRSGRGYVEVNYRGAIENAGRISARQPSVWPVPLRHRAVSRLVAMRRDGIDLMRRYLAQADWPGFSVLVYEVSPEHRILLDGNHRTAAALRARAEGDDIHLAVTAFVLKATPKASRLMSEPIFDGDSLTNEADVFNPDIAHVWRIARSEAAPTR